MFHFHLCGFENSLYMDISTIQPLASGLELSGTVGDGSAEAWFEAQLGPQIRARVLPVWDEEEETLCRRYDQQELETALQEVLADLSIHCDGQIDPQSGAWRQSFKVNALSSAVNDLPRTLRPHQQAHEDGPVWQRRAV